MGGELDAPSLALYAARLDGTGGRVRLVAAVNEGPFTLGPSVSAAEPGWLYVSRVRDGGAGRSDIWRVRYRLRGRR